jgi:N-acetylglucosamine-6-phosphate deacetylase
MTTLWSERAITPRGLELGVRVDLDGGRIRAVVPASAASGVDHRFPDATLAPGLVDLQVNGAQGVDYADSDPQARRRATEFHLRAGTTCLLPTLISAPLDALCAALRRLADDVRSQPVLAGIHLEGPFLAAAKAGAHDPRWLCDPDPGALARLVEAGGGALRLLTLAPERPGALSAIEELTRLGVRVAAGHTSAGLACMRRALDRGLSLLTHIGNASDWPTRRFDAELGYRGSEPGPVGAFLVDRRLRAAAILDGHHLHPELVRALVELRGRDALALVSDAAPFAGLPPGEYERWGMRARVHPGGFATVGEGLAGSTEPLVTGVRVAVERAGLSLVDALHMASTVPARLLALGPRKGSLSPGADADLLVLDAQLRPAEVFIAGRRLSASS